MLEVKHLKIEITGKYRIIVVSDIHSHLDRFQALLKEVNYQLNDYLVILGDFVEKGNQAMETVDYLVQLQHQNNRVFVILGNCEYALEEMVGNPKYAQQIIHYLNKIGKSGMIRQALKQLNLKIEEESPEVIQKQVNAYLQPYFSYFKTLPTTLQLNDFIFVHAGIENRIDWKNSKLSSLIEMQTFYQSGHCLNEYVVVGHLPTSNQHQNAINNNVIIDHQKKIISIDGGTGVKSISQLNALIIDGNDKEFNLTTNFVQPLPKFEVLVDIRQSCHVIHKVAWPNFEVKVLKSGKSFSTCLQVATNKIFRIKNEFLYQRDNKIYCLDDYVDNFISLNKGDVVKMAGIYGNYAYIIKDNQIGWVKNRYLKQIE